MPYTLGLKYTNHILFRGPSNNRSEFDKIDKIKNKKLEVEETSNNNKSAYFQGNALQNHTISSTRVSKTVYQFKQRLKQNNHQAVIMSTFIEDLPLVEFLDLVFYMCYSKNNEPSAITSLLYESLESNGSKFKLEQICVAIESFQKRLSGIAINKINSVYPKQENMQNTFIGLLQKVSSILNSGRIYT